MAAEADGEFPILRRAPRRYKTTRFQPFGPNRLIFVTFPSLAERACARNAKPANVSELL